MSSIQNPHKAPPGTVIRPDGTPAGRGGRGVLWLAVLVLGAAGVAYAVEHRPRSPKEEPVSMAPIAASHPELEPVPEPAPVEPIPDPLAEPEPEPPPPEEPALIAGEPATRCPDEVGCLLADDPPACCEQYSHGHRPQEPRVLERDDIKKGVDAVRAKIRKCGEKRRGVVGTVRVRCKVSPAGRITEATIVDSPDPVLGTCVAKAIGKAKFPKSDLGISFTYPFNF